MCLKYKGHRIAECTAGGSEPGEKGLKLNAMLDRIREKVDGEMDSDSEYLCSIYDLS